MAKIISVTLPVAQGGELLVARVKSAGDVNCLDELPGEIVICSTGRH